MLSFRWLFESLFQDINTTLLTKNGRKGTFSAESFRKWVNGQKKERVLNYCYWLQIAETCSPSEE